MMRLLAVNAINDVEQLRHARLLNPVLFCS